MANVVLGPVGAAPAAGRRVRGLCLPDGCLASLESSASMNETLLNRFRKEDNTDQTYNQEDLEYEKYSLTRALTRYFKINH